MDESDVLGQYRFEGIPVYCVNRNFFPFTRFRDTYYQPEQKPLLRKLLQKLKPDLVHVTHLLNHTAALLEVLNELQIPSIATLTDFFGICYNAKLEAADGTLCSGPNSSRSNCIACRLKDERQFPHVSRLRRWAGIHPLSRLTAEALTHIHRIPGQRAQQLAAKVRDITDRPGVMRTLYANYSTVIAPTRFLSEAYVSNGLNVPVRQMRFGVDAPRRPKPAREGSLRLKFAYIGQLAPHKGLSILLQAFSGLPQNLVALDIYGKEDQYPDYTTALKNQAADLRVRFCGTFPKENIYDVLEEVDFLVIPSIWYENSPLVLLNSLASHTPVVISDVEGMTEFVQDAHNGFIFRRGRSSDLARVFHQIVADPLRARSMSATTEYSRTVEDMGDDVLAVYDSVLRAAEVSPALAGD